jgi:hypothetical protein
VSYDEIEDMIKERVLDVLSNYAGGDVSADELADRAWESENCDGVVFYCNDDADRFVMRHGRWVEKALEQAEWVYGDAERYIKMKTECNDQFLVVAFMLATEHFLYDQAGIDRDEGDLSKTRIREITRLVKAASYDGAF